MLIFQAAVLASFLSLSYSQGPPPTKQYINATRSDPSGVELQINALGARNATAPLLYGWMVSTARSLRLIDDLKGHDGLSL